MTFNDLGVQKVKQNQFHAYDILLDPSQKRKIESDQSNTSKKLVLAGVTVLVLLIGAVLYSFAAVYGKRFKITNPLNASTGVILYSAIIMGIYIMLNFDLTPSSYGNSEHLAAVIILGVFCTAIATIIYFQILQSSGATFISIMNYLIPIWAILFGVIFFEEDVSWNYFLGLIIVIFGIQLSQNTRNHDEFKP